MTLEAGEGFQWPRGARVAVSLSFDDGRASQLDTGMDLLKAWGVRATFYVVPGALGQRLGGWRAAVAAGHEIGNHTASHPCSGNFGFSRRTPLEDWTLEHIERDIAEADRAIHQALGVYPRTFAYPCGQKFVGRGPDVQSYVPLIAQRYLAGRGFPDESHNAPGYCDPAQLHGCNLDGLSFDAVKAMIDAAVGDRGWLILVGHEFGASGRQTTLVETLEAICQYASDPANAVWLDTVAAVASHLVRAGGNGSRGQA